VADLGAGLESARPRPSSVLSVDLERGRCAADGQRRENAGIGQLAGRVEPRGRLDAMLDARRPPEVETSPAAALAGVRSATVDLEPRLSLSAKLLAALGVPVPGADVTASLWKGASGFTFEVGDVMENQVDVARLGRALMGRRIERTPATAVFLDGDGTGLYLLTRTLTSRSFAVRGTSDRGQSVKVAVGPIRDLLGKASATVSWSGPPSARTRSPFRARRR